MNNMPEAPEAQKRILGFPKNIFFLGFTSLFNDFSSEMVVSVFPAFFISVLKAGAASLGIVDGIAEAASNFFKIYSGNLSDRFQKRKPLIVAGYVLAVATRPFYVFVSTVFGALGLRFTDRIGKGLRDSPRDAVISLSTPKEELGRSFGYHRAMDTTGSILGPLVAYFLLRAFPLHFNTVFLTSFGIGVFAVLTLFFVSDVAISVVPKRQSIRASFGKFSQQFKIYALAAFVLGVGSVPVVVALLKTQSLHLMIADIPLFYMIYSVSYALFSLPAGKLSDRIGARSVITIGCLLLLASYAIMNDATSGVALAIGFFVFGLFPGLTDGVQRSLAAQLSGVELRGGALGILNAANGFGALVAGIALGYLWQAHGPSAAFLAASGTIFVGLCLLFLSRGPRPASFAEGGPRPLNMVE
jgi:MFS family permease